MSAARPLPAGARAARRLGVLGGSFDPPHAGHLHAARTARAAFELDHVLFVPAGRPPHKEGRALLCAPERLALLALLLAHEPACSVWDAELERAGPSYTVDTLRELAAELPGTRLFLVLGADNLPGFAHWHAAEEIVRLAQPVVILRPGSALPAAGGGLEELSHFARVRIALGSVACAPLEASSTELRQRLARGEAPPELLPAPLRAYIAERALYRAP